MTPQNIKLNHTRALDAKLVHDEYFDFMLYKGEAYGVADEDACLSTFIDFNNEDTLTDDGGAKSLVSWEDAVNDGITLEHIGWTAVDNGLINYNKYEISNKEFYDLFFNSELTIPSGDTEFRMYPVTGNTLDHCYDLNMDSESGLTYAALKGGFFQGFFKTYGYNYQTLPDYIEDDWHFEFVLRPRSDYGECETALNKLYPENKGLFFYIGTRAENKFGEIYNGIYSGTTEPADEYYHWERLEDKDIDLFTENIEPQDYLEDETDDVPSDEDLNSILNARQDEIEIETDNKFIFFNRTRTGFTVHTWDEEIDKIVLTGYKRREYPTNAFILFNRTCSGWTVEDALEYLSYADRGADSYDMNADTLNNAFALKYNDNGSITYRYTIKDCDAASGWTVAEETTLSGLVVNNGWNVINIRFAILDNSYRTCVTTDESGNTVYKQVLNNIGKRKMKIMIYVNGYLVFISKELPEFNFRQLNDTAEHQEGVPYNISLGGGTQGLGEKIWLNYRKSVTEHYELEKTYAGSFIGDIQIFKMFTCMQNYETIKNNYYDYMCDKEIKPFIDYNIIYVGSGYNTQSIMTDGNKQSVTTKDSFKIYDFIVEKQDAQLYIISHINNENVDYNVFSVGGSPLSVTKTKESIDGELYYVYKSDAVYPVGTKITVIAYNN